MATTTDVIVHKDGVNGDEQGLEYFVEKSGGGNADKKGENNKAEKSKGQVKRADSKGGKEQGQGQGQGDKGQGQTKATGNKGQPDGKTTKDNEGSIKEGKGSDSPANQKNNKKQADDKDTPPLPPPLREEVSNGDEFPPPPPNTYQSDLTDPQFPDNYDPQHGNTDADFDNNGSGNPNDYQGHHYEGYSDDPEAQQQWYGEYHYPQDHGSGAGVEGAAEGATGGVEDGAYGEGAEIPPKRGSVMMYDGKEAKLVAGEHMPYNMPTCVEDDPSMSPSLHAHIHVSTDVLPNPGHAHHLK